MKLVHHWSGLCVVPVVLTAYACSDYPEVLKTDVLETHISTAGASGSGTNDPTDPDLIIPPSDGGAGGEAGASSGDPCAADEPPIWCLAAECGDGLITGEEVCDDGNAEDGDGCSSACDAEEADYECITPGEACVYTVECGDGQVDSTYGEVCDDGVNDGGYGECEEGCRRGARCGDHILQETNGEECDDGNNRNGDGCNAECILEIIH